MIEKLSGFPSPVLAFACHGQVTAKDYETVLMPAVDAALAAHERVRLYYEIASDFRGIDAGAVWDDMKVGFEHLARWDRVALVSDVDWIRHTVSMFGFLMPGRVKVFSRDDAKAARAWLLAP